ncbi:secretion protein HlyD [Planctomycetota bacterium]|nr:secretion protein HlyD [Planctomycetota bacterium]
MNSIRGVNLRLALIGVLLFLMPACAPPAKTAQKSPVAPLVVSMVDICLVKMARTLDVTGVLAAQEDLALGFQVAGRLREMSVDVGDHVQEGQQLASLELADFVLAQSRSRAARTAARVKLGMSAEGEDVVIEVESAAHVREAQAVLSEAKLACDRIQQLVSGKLRAPVELDAAVAACQIADSRVQAAREQVQTWLAESQQRDIELQQSNKNLQDSKLASPFSGRVAERRAVVGQYVQAGVPVLELLRMQPMRLRLLVPERMASDVKAMMLVNFTVDGGGAVVVQGIVRRIGAVIDRSNRTLLVEAEVPNLDDQLRPGSFCRASIIVQPDRQVMAVPKNAVVTFAGIDRVYEVENGVAKERPVVIGRATGDLVEIQSGVEPGNSIIQDARGLLPNMPVTVRG